MKRVLSLPVCHCFLKDLVVVMVMCSSQIDPVRMTECRSCESARKTCARGV